MGFDSKEYTIKREIARTANYIIQEATDRHNVPVILLTLFGKNSNAAKYNSLVLEAFNKFQLCQSNMWDKVQISPHLKATNLLSYATGNSNTTITFYPNSEKSPKQNNNNNGISYKQKNNNTKINNTFNTFVPTHIPAYTSFSSSLPVVDPKEYVCVAIRILKLFWNIHMNGLVFIVPNILDLLWAGRIETIQLVSIGSISKPEVPLSAQSKPYSLSPSPPMTENSTPSSPRNRNNNDNNRIPSSPSTVHHDPTNLLNISNNENYLASVDYRYSSPEHTGRTGNPIDTRSDIYSLGVMLYLIATGTFPFSTTDPLELLHSHMTLTPPRLPDELWNNSSLNSIVTDIIHKMMRKSPKDRYQGLYGVIRDFELLLRQLENGDNTIHSFILGKHDGEDMFSLPEHKLYGREEEIENAGIFFNKFHESQQSAMFVVGGHSGVGKSAFIQNILEIQLFSSSTQTLPPVLLSGKHDRIKHTPYSAIIDALGGIVRKLLGLNAGELEWWADSLQRALSPNGQVLVEVIPEVAAIIGPQAPVPVLAPNEAKIRFERAVVSFVQIFTSKFCAILFLDDMQWADMSTIRLLESMLLSTTMKSLLIVCAYRDNEVGETHPFKILLDDMKHKGKNIWEVKLKELLVRNVAKMIMDIFYCDREKAFPFAELVNKRTNGNPFFVQQFMQQLVVDKLVTFDYKSQVWQWSLERLDAASCSENVVEFIIEKIKKMPAFVQKIMQHASCLGNTFDVATLYGIYSSSEIAEEVKIEEEENILAALQQGIHAGLIYQIRNEKIDDSGSYFQYKFIHDRVQEAFYESMEKKDRIQYHIASAEYFSSFSNFDLALAPQDTLFTIAHHYNLAIQKFQKEVEDKTADPKQIDHVVKVYFEAAKKAKQATAVEAASQFLSNASRLLPKDLIPAKEDHDYTEEEVHDPDYVFAFSFLILRAECDGNCGEVESSSRIIDYLLKRGRSVRDRVRACNLNCVVLEAAGNFDASVKAACMALEILSIPLQLQNNPIDKMVAEITQMVERAGGIHALLDRPPCSSLDALRIEVLSNMVSPTYIIANDIGMNLYYAVAALGTKISFERGIAPVSASVIACYAAVLTALRIHALDYAQMSMACLKRYPHAISTPRNNHYNACFTLWQGEKMKKVRKVFMEGFKGLVENGDTYSLYTTVCMIPVSFADSVDEVEGYLLKSLNTLKNIKSLHRTYVDCIAAIVHCFHILRSSSVGDEKDRISSPSTYSTLLSSSNSPNSLSNGKGSPKKLRPQHPMQQQNGELVWRGFTDGFDELAFAKANNDNNGAFFTCFLLHARMKTAMLLGNYELAEELASKFNPIACADLLVLFEWQMLCMILLAARTPVLKKGEIPSEEYTNNIKKIKEARAEVHFFDKSPCLDSIINLVDAEVARLESKNDEARRFYEISIKRARVAEIPSAQGFASELAMKFCLSIGDNQAACSYLSEAKGAYAIYGAFTKLQILDANYKELSKSTNESVFANMPTNSTSVAASPTAIDFASTMKACQVISSEVDVNKLLCSMIKITQQNTGAQKVYFIVPDQSGKLFIEAYGDANNNIGTAHCDLSQNKSNEASKFSVAVSIVNYVQYTKQIVILDDAANSGNFTFDTHVQANKVKSIFCVPVLHQNAVAGVLYFENNLLPGAFTQDRVQTIQLISGQLAVSYQNAILFKNLQSANEKLEQKNKALVEFDQMKDQFLANTSHELRTPLNGIIGLAEYLLEMENNHSKKDSLTMIAASGRRLAHLVNDILDTSALKAGAFTIRLKPTDLNLIVKNVTDLSYHLLGSKDITISNLVQDLPIMKLDESRMQQVLQNIVSNAIKFTHSGYVTVSSSVTNDWVSISVKDSGCGIAKEDQNMIFEEFKQVNGGINREAGGTGLGLSIAKKMVEMHEGRLYVESVVGQGSTFTISLPTSRITEEEAGGALVPSRSLKSQKTNDSPTGTKTITILSVDDEPINQAIMEKLLGANFNVLHANNGKEALELIMSSDHPPDFVLLDVMMPEMSGLEVCEKIREKFPMCDLPVIMVSAKGKPENIAEGLSKGANDYIIKPVDKSELLARIRLQISICLSCKMLCEKNHDHTRNSGEIHGEDMKRKEGILEMLVCEACKQVPTYPGQKSLLLGRRGSKIQLVQNIAEETRNILELTNQLPLMVTFYDLDGIAVVRNTDAATEFNKSPQTPRTKNNSFISSLQDRKEAESILSKVLAGDTVHHLYEISNGKTKTVIAICARMLQLNTQNRRQKTAYIFVGEQYIEQSATRRRSTSRAISTSTSPLLSSISSSTSTLAEPSIPQTQNPSPTTNPDPILISAYPPRLSGLLHFQSVDFTHLSPEQRTNLPKWINQVKTELALSQMAQNHSLISILFRPLYAAQPSVSVGFYHSCKLPSPSITLLRTEIEKRLNVDSSHIYAIVKDENVLVEFDDDLSNGTRLDVYLI